MNFRDPDRSDEPGERALATLTWFPAITDAELARRAGVSENHPALNEAREQLALGASHWFVCAGEACRGSARRALEQHGDAGVLSLTACQGHCDHAPVSVLRCGNHHEGLARYGGEEKRVADFARHAAAFDCLWNARDPVAAFRFDPLHGDAQTMPLTAFDFLAGHFRGRGRLGERGAPVAKELLGHFEASGQALTLRMRVDFTLRDGDRDHHEALVVITRENDAFVGRAVTDGGAHDRYRYQVENDGAILFDDRALGHGRDKRRARKRLTPTPGGYEERLEIETEPGRYEELYCVEMIRTSR